MAPVRRSKRASDILELVGMREREYFMPNQLSGGQAQRAAIARALVNKPSIIIADEPTGNLDSHDSKVVMELLEEVHRQGNTVLMVTHNPELTRYATRVIYMYDGMIAADESTVIGQMAPSAKRTFFRKKQITEDDIAAGVSALLKDVPGTEITTQAKRKKAKGKGSRARLGTKRTKR
jgi:putative ABC transport system ATP-binding protein